MILLSQPIIPFQLEKGKKPQARFLYHCQRQRRHSGSGLSLSDVRNPIDTAKLAKYNGAQWFIEV